MRNRQRRHNKASINVAISVMASSSSIGKSASATAAKWRKYHQQLAAKENKCVKHQAHALNIIRMASKEKQWKEGENQRRIIGGVSEENNGGEISIEMAK